jgi:hypothetical protein
MCAPWGALGVALAMISCTSSAPKSTTPTAPSPSSNSAQPVATVSGAVMEVSANGFRPLGGISLQVSGYRNLQTPVTVDVTTNSEGQYSVPGLIREYAQVTAAPREDYLSPCSVRLWLWGDDPLNVYVVSRAQLLGSGVSQLMPPFVRPPGYFSIEVLSGFVTERTQDGARPVSQASVEHFYGDGTSGTPTGFTVTNTDGYYVLCGYQDDYGQSLLVRKDGYRTSRQSIGASSRIDLELARN